MLPSRLGTSLTAGVLYSKPSWTPANTSGISDKREPVSLLKHNSPRAKKQVKVTADLDSSKTQTDHPANHKIMDQENSTWHHINKTENQVLYKEEQRAEKSLLASIYAYCCHLYTPQKKHKKSKQLNILEQPWIFL